jgi:hypothetical protein
MLTTKTIRVYGDDSVINQLKDDSGIYTSVKFLTIDEIAFLRVVIKSIIEKDSHSYLMTDDQLLELYKKLIQSSVLYETPKD